MFLSVKLNKCLRAITYYHMEVTIEVKEQHIRCFCSKMPFPLLECDQCHRIGTISRCYEMPLNNIFMVEIFFYGGLLNGSLSTFLG